MLPPDARYPIGEADVGDRPEPACAVGLGCKVEQRMHDGWIGDAWHNLHALRLLNTEQATPMLAKR
ncbi:hypothetical protein D3C72_2277280 [compost metagenome]